MAAPATNWCFLAAVLLIIGLSTDICFARPQGDDVQAASPKRTARLAKDEPNFAADSWQPVSPDVPSGLTIDQAPTRVRIEKSESAPRDGRSKEVEPQNPPLISSTNHTLSNSTTTTRSKSPSPLGDAIKMVANQLLQSRGAVDEADVRTPPKMKNQPVTEEPSHNGVAIPVVDEEEEDLVSETSTKATTTKKPVTSYKKNPSTEIEKKTSQSTTRKPTPTSRYPVTSIPDGLTTWVFLSGSSPSTLWSVSTDSPSPVTKAPVEVTTKKTQKTTPATIAEKSNVLARKPSPLFTSSGTKPFPQRITKKPIEEITMKNSTVNKKESSATLASNEAKEKVTKKPDTTPEIAFRRRPTVTEVETTTLFRPMPTAYSIRTTSPSEESTEEVTESSTDVNTETTSKRTRLPGEKKKKNKNKRRRRPTKKPADSVELESKVGNDTKLTKVTKVKPKPMGTRIYNYLAREVMPSVGVGLIGLVGLAGLAGLILYPFGGGTLPIRRNYNESPNSNYYYYNKDRNDGSETEEEVFGKVVAGMKDPSYVTGEQYPDVAARNPTQDDKYTRFDVDTGAGQQQGNADYNRYNSGSSQENINSDSYYKSSQETQTNDDKYNSYNVNANAQSSKAEEYDSYGMGSRVNTNAKTPVTSYDSGEAVSKTRDASRPEVKKPQQAHQYAGRTEPRPVYLSNDWGVVKTDQQEAESANKPQALMYRGEEEPIYGQNARQDTSYAVQSPQYSGVSRVGVGQRRITAVEHGPRRLRRESHVQESVTVDSSENEIDNDASEKPIDDEVVEVSTESVTAMPEGTTTVPEVVTKNVATEKVVEVVTISPVGGSKATEKVVEVVTISPVDGSKATEKPAEVITIEPENPEDMSLFGLIRRVAQFKVRLGISFMRNTSQAFTRYLDRVQERVKNATMNSYRYRLQKRH